MIVHFSCSHPGLEDFHGGAVVLHADSLDTWGGGVEESVDHLLLFFGGIALLHVRNASGFRVRAHLGEEVLELGFIEETVLVGVGSGEGCDENLCALFLVFFNVHVSDLSLVLIGEAPLPKPSFADESIEVFHVKSLFVLINYLKI